MAAIGFCCDLWWPHTDFVVLFFILSELVPFSKVNIRFSAQLISTQYYEVVQCKNLISLKFYPINDINLPSTVFSFRSDSSMGGYEPMGLY